MPKLIFGYENQIAEWVVSHIPHVHDVASVGPFTTLGVADDAGTKLLAGAIYHNYVPAYGHAEITFAADSPRWATRGVIRAILSVPFDQWQCRRVTAVTPHTNDVCLKFLRGIGFVREGTVRHYFAHGVHAAIYGMTRGEYRNLMARYGHRTEGVPHGEVVREGASGA